MLRFPLNAGGDDFKLWEIQIFKENSTGQMMSIPKYNSLKIHAKGNAENGYLSRGCNHEPRNVWVI